MTDEEMDARLRAAGERWRVAAESPGTGRAARPQDPLAPIGAVPRRRHRVGLLASAAVVVAALAAGGGYVLSGTSDHHDAGNDTRLDGTVWRLLGYDDERVVNSTASFYVGANGALVADDSCTVIGAKASVGAGRMHVTDVSVRDRSCTDSAGDVTFSRALPVLTDDPRYTIDGGTLTIRAPGKPILHLAAAEHLPPPTLDVPTLVGATWRLSSITDGSGDTHRVYGAPTLTISGARLTASDGCNSMSGDVRIDGWELALADVASTLVGCPGDTRTSADVVDRFFAGPTLHAVLEGASLTLKGDGIGELIYRWVPHDAEATDPLLFTERTWRLAFASGEPVGVPATLRVDADGTVTGNDGCARLSGHATVTAGVLNVTGVPEQADAGCPDVSATLDSYLASGPLLWRISAGKLVLTSGAQASSLLFRTAVPPPAPARTDPLVGHIWRLTQITKQTANSASGEGASNFGVSLYFPTATTVRLLDRCEQDEATVGISKVLIFATWTRQQHSCPYLPSSSPGRQEADGLDRARATLSGTVQFSVAGKQLTLTKADTTLTFER